MKKRNYLQICIVGLFTVFFVPFTSWAFSDVDGHGNEEAILYLEDKGIVEGYADGTYGPDKSINRAEFLKILLESADVEVSDNSNCFPDVGDDWYAKYVCSAKDLDIVSGYPDGFFRPANDINLAEALKIVLETYGFEIADSGGEWYEKYYDYAYDNELLDLIYINVSHELTRGEMAQLIYNVENFQEELVGASSCEYNGVTYEDGEDITSIFTCIANDENTRNYEMLWNINPETIAEKLGEEQEDIVTIPLPQTNDVYQVAEWEVVGEVDAFTVIEYDGNQVLEVQTHDGEPFVLEGYISVVGYDFDSLILNAQEMGYPDSVEKYLEETDIYNYNDSDVANIAASLNGESRYEMIKSVMEWVNNHLRFINEGEDQMLDAQASEIINVGYGHCENLSTAIVTLLRANGIPARSIRGYGGLDEDEGTGSEHTVVEYYVTGIGWMTWDHGYEPFESRSTYVEMYHYELPKESFDQQIWGILGGGENCEEVQYEIVEEVTYVEEDRL
ncbi:MAG: S-layer homology domain-containing protein [Candidatus Gracilibacteria bacterium]|jgi:hypothetical protein